MMTFELRHRRKLPPIERMIRRIRDAWRRLWAWHRVDLLELVSCFVIALLVTGLVFFAIDTIRKARP